MADITSSLKSLSTTQWVLIGGAGIAAGIIWRIHNKNKQASLVAADTSLLDQTAPTSGAYAGIPPTAGAGSGSVSFQPGGSQFPVSLTGYTAQEAQDLIKTLIPTPAAPAPSPGPAPGPTPFFTGPRGDFGIPERNFPVPAPVVASPSPTPPPTPPAPTVMSQGMYLGAFLPQNVGAFTAPGGYLDKFFQNPQQYQILNPDNTPATTSQVLMDLQARGIPILPTWKAIN